MGTWATAKRSSISDTFEAGSGDMQGETEPVFIWRRDLSPKDAVIRATITRGSGKLHLAYTAPGLDGDDVERIFHIAYLDVLTGHHDQKATRSIVLLDEATGNQREIRYPDPE